MDTSKLVHLPPTTQKLIAAAEHVTAQWGSNDNDTDAMDTAVKELKQALRAFGPQDSRKAHVKDPRQHGGI